MWMQTPSSQPSSCRWVHTLVLGAAGWWPHSRPIARLMSSCGGVYVCLPPQEGAVPGLECFPVPIMRWTEQFFLEVFQKHGGFRLREHGEQTRVSSGRAKAGCECRVRLRLGARTLSAAVLTATRRLCLWGAQVWRQCAGHHQQALAAPHLPAVGLRPSQHGCADQPQEAASIQTGR